MNKESLMRLNKLALVCIILKKQEIINKAIEYMDRRDLEWGSDEHNKMMNILKGGE